jgi:hypothetical protein
MYIHTRQQRGEDVSLSEDKQVRYVSTVLAQLWYSNLTINDPRVAWQMLILIIMAFPTAVLTLVLVIFVLFHTVYLPCCGQEGYLKDGLASCLGHFADRLLCGCCSCATQLRRPDLLHCIVRHACRDCVEVNTSSPLRLMYDVLCRENTGYREIEAGAPAGTKAFCNRNKPKKEMTLDSPTDGSRQSAGGAETPPTPQDKENGDTTVRGAAPPATPARHAQHPKKSAVGAPGANLRADDGGTLSGVVGWELSDGKTMRLCMPKLMQPRRQVLKEKEPPADNKV